MNIETVNKTTTTAFSRRLAGQLLLATERNLLGFLDYPGTQCAPGFQLPPPSGKECNCTDGNTHTALNTTAVSPEQFDFLLAKFIYLKSAQAICKDVVCGAFVLDSFRPIFVVFFLPHLCNCNNMCEKINSPLWPTYLSFFCTLTCI